MLASGAAATSANSASLSFGLNLKAGDTLTFSCDVKTTGNRVAMHAQYYNGSTRWKALEALPSTKRQLTRSGIGIFTRLPLQAIT